MHDGLDIVLFVGRLHEHGDDQLEESQDVGAGLVLGDLDQVYILSDQRFPTFLDVRLHALHDYLQIGQFLDPFLRTRLQVLQGQREMLDRCQQMRKDHTA